MSGGSDDKVVALFAGLEGQRALGGRAAELVRNVGEIAAMVPDMEAYVVMGVSRDGAYSIGWRCDAGGLMSPTLFASFAMEVIRREIVTQSEVIHVLNRENGGGDGS